MASHALPRKSTTRTRSALLYRVAHILALASAYLIRDYDAGAYDPQWQAAIRRMAERRQAGRPLNVTNHLGRMA